MEPKKKKGFQDLVQMSDVDRAAYDKNASDWAAANAAGDKKGMESAHAAQEALRGRYGYSGGADGSGYAPVKGGFSTNTKPSYVSPYADQIKQIMGQIQNRPAFEYDVNKDPAYAAYRDQYTRLGKQAMDDTVAQMAARTGGLASSFAGTAGQQAYDRYMDALGDKVPELQALAHQMYRQEGDDMRGDLGILMQLENQAFGQHNAALQEWLADRQFEYGQNRDQIADQRYQDQLDYQHGRDDIADKRWEQQWQHGLDRESIEDKRWDQQWQHGLDREAVEDKRYREEMALRKLARSSGGSRGGSHGGSSHRSSSKPKLTAAQAAKAIEDGIINDTTVAAYEYYFGQKPKKSSSDEPEVNTSSVLNLGYGPISASRLADLEAKGEIESYEENGMLNFKKRPARPGSSIFDRVKGW